VAKVYARRNRYEVDPNQELVALGAANVTAGVFSGQPVTGGFSRTAVNATAGARTPLASMVSAGLIVLVLLFATGLFTELPQAVLGAIVIAAVASLFDFHEMVHIVKVKRSDAVTMSVAFLATLLLGVELGIAAGSGRLTGRGDGPHHEPAQRRAGPAARSRRPTATSTASPRPCGPPASGSSASTCRSTSPTWRS
jgi:hypothetical protein